MNNILFQQLHILYSLIGRTGCVHRPEICALMLHKFVGETLVENFYSIAPLSCFCFIFCLLGELCVLSIHTAEGTPSMPLMCKFGLGIVLANY